jgi:hypothetical protein
VPIGLVALLTIAVVTPVAAGGKPDSFPQEPVAQEFPDSCDFPVALQDAFAAGKVLIFPTGDDGSTLLMATGGFKSTIWNVEHPDISLDITFFGHAKLRFLEDGNIEIQGSGQGLWWFTDEADAAMYGLEPGIYLITGRVDVLTDDNQVALEPARMHARVRDLCAELAPTD